MAQASFELGLNSFAFQNAGGTDLCRNRADFEHQLHVQRFISEFQFVNRTDMIAAWQGLP